MDQMKTWETLMLKLKSVIKEKGFEKMEMVLVEANPNPQEQFKKYQDTCEATKEIPNIIVSTGLPQEVDCPFGDYKGTCERLFWPYGNVQFYIYSDAEKIHCTGNEEIMNQILKEN